MAEESPPEPAPPWGAVVLLALVFLLAALPCLASHDLWDPDEPRYGRVAQELIDRGEPFLLTVNGEPYSHKPPLQFWLVAALAKVFTGGVVGPVVARLPSLVAAFFSLLLVARLAWRLTRDRHAPWLAVLVLGTSVRFLINGTSAHIDSLLTLAALGAIEGFLASGCRTGFRFWLPVAAGFLAKGPVILLVTLAAVLPELARQGRLGRLVEARSLAAGTAALLVVAAWVVPAVLQGPAEFRHDLLVGQTLERITTGRSHVHPWHYYLSHFPPEFLPWVLLFLGPLWTGLRGRPEAPAGAPPGIAFAARWFSLGFIAFSLITEKRSLYLLPLFPAAALVVAAALARAMAAGRLAPGERLAGALTGLALVGTGAYVMLAPPAAVAAYRTQVPGFALPVALGGAVALGAGLAASPPFLVLGLGLATATGFLGANLTLYPALDPVRSARRDAAAMEADPDRPAVILYRFFIADFALHLRRNLPVPLDPAALAGLFRAQPASTVVCQAADLAAVRTAAEAAGRTVREVAPRNFGTKDMAIVQVR